MSQGSPTKVTDARRQLVERIALSPYLNRSARLRDLLLYVTDRVLEDDALEIHEQELGHKVFGRPEDYDTAADNIVRVHASMLRKRLEQYFAGEGAAESMLLEIPKGNYAPVFRERTAPPRENPGRESLTAGEKPKRDWRLPAAIALAAVFACSTVLLLVRGPAGAPVSAGPSVRLFWSQIFRPDRPTDVVVDDAAVGLYQELTGHPLSLSEYYDHSYLRGVPAMAAEAKLEPRTAEAMTLRRHASYADTSFLWKLLQLGAGTGRWTNLRFARDYSFHELKANSAILLGNGRSNPWVQAFEPKLGIRWQFDKDQGVYYPVDTWDAGRSYLTGLPAAHDAYFSVALLPNLGGTGNVLLVSATGGSAVNAAADFLSDEGAMAAIRGKLPATSDQVFPAFEALVKTRGRGGRPRDAAVVLCRPASK